MTVALANAPCSYGAFEITAAFDGLPTGDEVLQHVAAAGYDGIDLGDVGYLGTKDNLDQKLKACGLRLAGGFVGLPFSEPDLLGDYEADIAAVIEILDAVEKSDAMMPRPTLVDAGSPERVANPGHAARDRSLGLDEAGWQRFAQGLERVADVFRNHGYEPTFHPHTATYVEAVWEIEELLNRTTVGICVDTGHVLVGGGDPAESIRAWSSRINHIHIKDAHLHLVEEIVETRQPVQEIWRQRAFPALGTGDIDLESVISAIKDIEYSGWIVVEQDIFPDPATIDQTLSDQVANLAYLRQRGL